MDDIKRLWREINASNIPVCDQWKSYKIFKKDLPSIPGYELYEKSEHPEGFRLEITQADKVWGLMYSPNTVYLTDVKVDHANASHFIGVTYDIEKQMYMASLQYGTESYCLGYYTSEVAAASAYNYIASQLVGCQVNRLHLDLKPEEWVTYKDPEVPMEIPYDLMIPSHIMNLCGIKKRTGSTYNGVYVVAPSVFRAYYQDFEGNLIIIGEYNSEIVAASAYEYYCRKHGFSSGNTIPYLIPENQLEQNSYNPSKVTSNLQIGSVYTSASGEKYKIINIESKDLSQITPNTQVFIQFLETGHTAITTAHGIKYRIIKDRETIPTVQSIASLNRSLPTDDKLTYRIYQIWYRMLKRVLTSHPDNPLEILDERWLSFANFYEDIMKMEGNHYLRGRYAKFCNTKYQMHLPPEQRKYNPQVCYISIKMIEEKYQFIADHKEGEYIGVQPVGRHWVFEISRTPYSNKKFRQYYSNFVAAVNAYNYYFQYYFGVAPNPDIPPMSHDEFIKFRVTQNPIQQLYHLV